MAQDKSAGSREFRVILRIPLIECTTN